MSGVSLDHVCWWLTSKSSLLRRQRSGGSRFKASPGKIVCRPLSQKIPSQKRAGGMAQGIGLEFKLQYHKKKKNLKKKTLLHSLSLKRKMLSSFCKLEEKGILFSFLGHFPPTNGVIPCRCDWNNIHYTHIFPSHGIVSRREA
jgi:hypothetical protein